MKKFICPFVVFAFLFSVATTAQTINKPTIATKNVNKKALVSKEKTVLSTASKKTAVDIKKKNADLPKKNGGNTPRLGVMNKKEK